MKVSFMVPKKYWSLAKKYSDYYLVLAHWITNEDADMFRGKYVVLDNGAYELGKSVDFDVYNNVIEIFKPNEIILPDHRFCAPETMDLARDFLHRFYDERYKYVGAVQGKEWDEWFQCYKYFLSHRKIDVIGITDVPTYPTSEADLYQKSTVVFSRVFMLRWLDQQGLLIKPIHILGSIDPIELPFLAEFKKVEKTDSKIAFWNGVHLDKLSLKTGLRRGSQKHEGMDWNFSDKLSWRQRRIIYHNMKVFRKLANGG